MRARTFISAAILFGLTAALSWGQIIDDPLHGFCTGVAPACNDNGTNTPIPTNPPTGFGFTISPGPQTGDFLLEILVPGNQQTAGASYTITGTQGGTSNTSAISATAKLFSSTDWSSGALDTYLGLSASPNNPIGAYLPTTKTYDSTATGFSVYQADLGQTQILANSNASGGPQLALGSSLPQGSYIVSFLTTGSGKKANTVATANSGALLITGSPSSPSPVPEPTSWLLLGTFALGLVGLRWRVKKA